MAIITSLQHLFKAVHVFNLIEDGWYLGNYQASHVA